MNYNESVGYITRTASTGSRPGLERITELLSLLGNPEKKLKIIHVAGTNGKGSFCSMLDSVLLGAGYKTALFTSPHMLRYNERIKFCGEDISDGDFSSLVEEIMPVAEGMDDKPTEFELLTAMGYLWFSRKKPDYCIIECGMGGRYDATNVIDDPVLSVIVGISLDHTNFLGNTLSLIAGEKAGIIKHGRPVLYGGGDREEAFIRIADEAASLSSPIYLTDRGLIGNTVFSIDGTSFDYKDKKELLIHLAGHYQPYNAANVIEAADILNACGAKISDSALRCGLADAKWIGRFEKLCDNPVTVFDGGHNIEGVTEAVSSAKSIFGEQKLTVISGVLADKEYRAMANKIAEIAGCIFTVTPDSCRALSAEKYADVYSEIGINAISCSDFETAVRSAFSYASEHRTPLLCLGSLYSYESFVTELEKVKKGHEQ